jgi:copper transport protein
MCLWALASLLDASAAAAHATVVSTTPENGAILDAPIQTVRITFSEVVDPRAVTVVDESGQRTDIELARAETLEVPVATDQGGWFAVSWRVISDDGHPVGGAITFRVGAGSAEAPEALRDAVAGASDSGAADLTRTVARALALGGLLVLAGSAFLRLWALDAPVPAVRRLALASAGVAVVGAIGALTSAAVGDLVTWPGTVADAAPIIAAVGLAWRTRERRAAITVVFGAAIGALATAGLTGHVAADGRLIARVGLAAHLIAAAVWLGGIPSLLLAVRGGGWAIVGRFSRAATIALGVVALAGTSTALVIAGDVSVIFDTTWGRLLAAKVALVGLAVGAGAANRTLLRDRSRHDVLRRLLAVEGALLVAIVATSGAVTRHSPEASGSAGDEPILATVDAGPLAVEVAIGAPDADVRALHVTVYEGDQPLEIEDLTLALASEPNGIAAIPQRLDPAGTGHYIGATDDLRLRGTWTIEVVVRVDTFTEHSGSTQIDLS